MQTIKEYLKERVSDEEQIRRMLETCDAEIRKFFIDLWERQLTQVAESDSQQSEPTENNTTLSVSSCEYLAEAQTQVAESNNQQAETLEDDTNLSVSSCENLTETQTQAAESDNQQAEITENNTNLSVSSCENLTETQPQVAAFDNQQSETLENNTSLSVSSCENLAETQTQATESDSQHPEPQAELFSTVSETAIKAKVQTVDIQQQPEMPKKFDSGVQFDREKAQKELLTPQIKSIQITVPNGKVGQEYCTDFDFEKLGIAEVSFAGLEKIGLQYFPEEKRIKGSPTEAGDHRIRMNFKLKDWTEGKPILTKEVIFIINPDPKSLWKNIPTPKDIEYYKDDCDKQFCELKSQELTESESGEKAPTRKGMIAASQRGRSHAIEGKPRDDDFALYFDKKTEWYIMVVADGAGSAKFSRKGSRIACLTAMNICKELLAATGASLEEQIIVYSKESAVRQTVYEHLHNIAGKAAFEAYKEICKEAVEKQRAPREYATTLLLSICKKFDFGWFIGAFWVGDGGIGIYRNKPEDLKILGEPDGGEFAGQTRFLTMPEIFSDKRVRTRFVIVDDFTALILMTDGVTDPKFETDANLNKIEKWHALWDDLNGKNEDKVKVDFTDDNEQAANQLLKWLDFWSKGNHDDRTIAILF